MYPVSDVAMILPGKIKYSLLHIDKLKNEITNIIS